VYVDRRIDIPKQLLSAQVAAEDPHLTNIVGELSAPVHISGALEELRQHLLALSRGIGGIAEAAASRRPF
jgi:hypothetical protein